MSWWLRWRAARPVSGLQRGRQPFWSSSLPPCHSLGPGVSHRERDSACPPGPPGQDLRSCGLLSRHPGPELLTTSLSLSLVSLSLTPQYKNMHKCLQTLWARVPVLIWKGLGAQTSQQQPSRCTQPSSFSFWISTPSGVESSWIPGEGLEQPRMSGDGSWGFSTKNGSIFSQIGRAVPVMKSALQGTIKHTHV